MTGNVILKINWSYSSRLKKSIRFNKSFNTLTINAPKKFSEILNSEREDLEEYAKLRIRRKPINPGLKKRVQTYFTQYFETDSINRQFYIDQSVHNLEDYFNHLNAAYFDNKCRIESIGWSYSKTKRLLGKWCDLSKNHHISSYLNSKKIPRLVVEFIVYHEMCHQIFPPIQNQNRRSVHHKRISTK